VDEQLTKCCMAGIASPGKKGGSAADVRETLQRLRLAKRELKLLWRTGRSTKIISTIKWNRTITLSKKNSPSRCMAGIASPGKKGGSAADVRETLQRLRLAREHAK